ncbi:MAG: CrcB family protein [Puniceicoccales bacterium]|jgi:CrcB protein|nr:CrcB family protein [Puniceicoccales bacterium]
MTWQWASLVATGGAAGALARGALGFWLKTSFPWPTLIANVLGALLAGWLMGRLGAVDATVATAHWQALLVTGFCGGFTTLSSFSWQTLEQFNRGQWQLAFANIALTLTLSLFAAWAGFRCR